MLSVWDTFPNDFREAMMDVKVLKNIGQLMGRTKFMIDAEMNRRIQASGGPNWLTLRALIGIAEDEGLPQSMLAMNIEADPAAVSRFVPQLVNQGYLRVEPDSTDRRIRRLFLTDAGRAMLAQYEWVPNACAGVIMAEVSETDLRHFESILQRIHAAVVRLCEGTDLTQCPSPLRDSTELPPTGE
jgi:DNA-binding MarR family transcriptional regulator